MNQPNRQPDLHDEQAVIAAVQLLVRSMKPAQKEKLLSTLMHEQGENLPLDDGEPRVHEGATDTGLEEETYPIQPLLLASDEGQHASSGQSRDGETASEHQERRPWENYATLFLPLASSFSRRQWWTRMALGAIFLCLLSVSSLVSYKMGVHAGAINTPPPAAGCHAFAHYPMGGVQYVLSPDTETIVVGKVIEPPQTITNARIASYVVNVDGSAAWVISHDDRQILWTVAEPCSTDQPAPNFPFHHHHDDDGD